LESAGSRRDNPREGVAAPRDWLLCCGVHTGSERPIDDPTTEITHTDYSRAWHGAKMSSDPIRRRDRDRALEATWTFLIGDQNAAGGRARAAGDTGEAEEGEVK
jgi:hypothetical protein